MGIEVDRLVAQIDADASGALSVLTSYNLAVLSASQDHTSHITVDADTSGAAAASAEMAALNAQSGSASSGLANVGSAASGASGILGSLGAVIGGLQFGGIYTAATMAAGGIQMLGAAAAGAIGAIGPLIGLLGAIPVGLGAIAGGLGATLLGFSGVAAGVKALDTATAGSARSTGTAAAASNRAADAAYALQNAQNGVKDAQNGVVDAQRAYKDSLSAIKDAQTRYRDSLQAITDAQDRYKESLEAVKEAEEAQKDAAEQIGKAREQAAKDLINDARDVRDAVWNEQDAVERLKQAQENLARAQSATSRTSSNLGKATDEFTGKVYEVATVSSEAVNSSMDRAAAEREVAKAQQDLQRAQERTKDSRDRLNEAQKKGIEGSDIVQEALKREAKAEAAVTRAKKESVKAYQGIAKAQRESQRAAEGITKAQEASARAYDNIGRAQQRLKQAQEAVTRAQQKNAQAIGGVSIPAFSALNRAMDGLSPAGQRFVRFLHDTFLPAFKKIKFAAQEGLLPGVQAGLTSAMKIFPMLEKRTFQFAKTMGDHFAGLMEHIVSPDMAKKLDDVLGGLFDVLNGSTDASGKKFKGILDAAIPLYDIFLALTKAATPMTKLLTDKLVTGLGTLAEKMSSVGGQKKLTDFFDNAAHFAGLWWDVLKPLGQSLGDLVTASQPLAEWMLKEMAKQFENMHKWTSSTEGQKKMLDFFENMKPALRETGGLLKDIGGLLFGTKTNGEDSAYVKVVKEIRSSLLPALKDLMEDLDKSNFGANFVKLLSGVIWVIDQFVKRDGAISLIVEGISSLIDGMKNLDKATDGKSTDVIMGIIAALGAFKIVKGIGGILNRAFIQPIAGTVRAVTSGAGKILGAFKKGPEGQASKFTRFFDTIRLKAMYMGDKVKAGFATAKTAISGAASSIAGKAKSIATATARIAGNAASAAKNFVVNSAKIVAQWVVMAARATANAARMAVAWLIGVIRPAATATASMVATGAKIVAQWVAMAVKSAANAARMAVAWVIGIVGPAATALGAMIATAAVVVAQWVRMGVQSMIQAARMAAAWVIAMGPIALIIAAVVGLAILIWKNWDTIWNKTKEIWNWIWGAIEGAVTNVVNFVRDHWQLLLTLITGPISIAVGLVTTYWDEIWTAAKNTWNWIWDKITWFGGLIWDFFSNWNVIGIILTHWDSIWKGAKKLWDDVWKRVTDFGSDMTTLWNNWGPIAIIEKAWDSLYKSGKKLWDDLWGFVTGFTDKVTKFKFTLDWSGISTPFKSAINTIIRWWNGLSFKIPKIDTHIPGVPTVGGGTISFPRVAELKQFGGSVQKGQPYIVGEKRPELFIPSANGRIMPRAVQSGSASSGGGITEAQLDRLLQKVLEKAKPNVDMQVTQNEKADPMVLSRELAWSLR